MRELIKPPRLSLAVDLADPGGLGTTGREGTNDFSRAATTPPTLAI